MGGFSGGNSGANDTDVSGAEAVTTGGTTFSDKKINTNTNQPKGNDNPEKDDTAAKLDLFYEKGPTKIKETVKGGAGAALLSKPLQVGSRKTREFFTDKVLGSKNYKDTSKEDFMNLSATQQEEMYQDYIGSRQAGDIDAYGNQIGTGRDDSSLAARTQKKSIKSIEQPQTETQMNDTKPDGTPKGPTDVEMDDDTILVRNKKKGRRKTILTDPLGVDEEVTLSNKKLLG